MPREYLKADYDHTFNCKISGSHGGEYEDVFWVVAPCRAIALMMEAASTSETSVNVYQTTRRNNPEDSHLYHFHCLPRFTIFTIICTRKRMDTLKIRSLLFRLPRLPRCSFVQVKSIVVKLIILEILNCIGP
jgi:hypothetical protein